jgi:hypothetical protein
VTRQEAAQSQWGKRIELKSESSSRIYVVSEKLEHGQPTGTYGCSCPGWKSYGQCKHLRKLGLKSCRSRTAPRPKGLGAGDNTSFTNAAYAHYDTRGGYGSADDWIRAAEALAGERGRYREPPRANRARPAGVTPDMALLGLTAMPADARGLLSAMRARARVLHPDLVHPTDSTHRREFPQCPKCDAAVRAFTAMMMAYERLLNRYPKK